MGFNSAFKELINKRYDTFWRVSQYFLYIYDRWVKFFIKASQAPSYSRFYQTPANTFAVLL